MERQLDEEHQEAIESHAAECSACGELLTTARELTCQQFVEFLDDYVEDRLDEERRSIFERHLAICQECTDYLDSYRTTIAAARASGSDIEAADVPDELIQAVLRSLRAG